MDLRADLHLHTTASDGRWTPEELVAQVRQANLTLFSVTDHDALGSLAPVARLVRGSGLRFLPGVELTARLEGQMYHLLAYGFDAQDAALNDFVTANNARLQGSNDETLRLLIEAGYPLSMADYAAYTWDRRRGGWKVLNFLIDRGICRDAHSFFNELFGGELTLPEVDFPPPSEAISVVRAAGGLVVLAHPGVGFYNGLDWQGLDRLVEMGVQGLECYSYHHDEDQTRDYLAYCRSRDLLITGGSDSHGGFVGRTLGVPPISIDDLRLGPLADKVIT